MYSIINSTVICIGAELRDKEIGDSWSTWQWHRASRKQTDWENAFISTL